MRLPSILVGSWLVVASSLCADAQALQVLRITPSGEDVPPGPQIVIQFDRAVVPIGRMDRGPRDVPAHVEPDPGCRWTWIDPTALACQLDSDHQLAPATRYEVEVRPPLRAIDGATLAAPVRSSFLTQRPDVEQAWFDTWVT